MCVFATRKAFSLRVLLTVSHHVDFSITSFASEPTVAHVKSTVDRTSILLAHTCPVAVVSDFRAQIACIAVVVSRARTPIAVRITFADIVPAV